MPNVPLLFAKDAPPEVRALYEDFYRRMSFPAPPNFIMTQGHSVSAARGSWDLVRNVLVGGEIPRWIKEMVFVAISKERGCHYCEAAHLACCRMLGVDLRLLDSLVGNIATFPDPRVRDMILFAAKCARSPQELNESDFATLRRHGLSHSQTIELIAMSGLAVYANIMADGTAMEADAMFGEIG